MRDLNQLDGHAILTVKEGHFHKYRALSFWSKNRLYPFLITNQCRCVIPFINMASKTNGKQ